MKQFLVVCFFFTVNITFSQTQRLVYPNIADPLSSAPNNYHFCYINYSAPQKNKLFLFFPGTGGVPYNYQEILKHAANLGYHSIGLTYSNSLAINELCLNIADTTCHSRARLEIFDGIDRHEDIDVDSINSIEHRTLMLLKHLSNNYPFENWDFYFSGNEVNWEKIIVSGHSQGGSHAGIISKIKPVSRVVMFAATDWIAPLSRNADWITWPGQTPTNVYYGFIHGQDDGISLPLEEHTWNNYGMNNYGAMVFVDTTTPPFNNSRMLYTLETPENDPTQYHGSVAGDMYTPMVNGSPLFAPIWTYLIDSDAGTLSINSANNEIEVNIFPNPCVNQLYLSSTIDVFDYTVIDVYGQVLQSGKAEQIIDVQKLSSGTYFIQLKNNHQSIALKRFVKTF